MSVAARVAGAVSSGLRRTQAVPRMWIAAGSTGILILLLPLLFPLNGRAHADWLQFLGRFHPLLVHLPIGLIVLWPLLEIGGTERPAFREAAGFVLQLAFATSLAAILFGLLLAYGSGEIGTTVTRHMRGGIALALELLLALTVRDAWLAGQGSRWYFLLLTAALATLAWTAHQGGSLTHGSDYLTRYMPLGLRMLLAPSAVSSHPDSFFAKQIFPVLDAKCVACHGTNKEQGGLRLDSYESLMAGGKDGIVIAPRNPDGSLLLQKVTLPPSDPHFMPAEGRTPLTPDEISTIRAWVKAGASSGAVRVPGISLAEDPEEPPPVGDYSAFMGEIRQMDEAQGAKLVPVSANPADGLILRTTDVGAVFDDAQLRKFQRFAPFIVEAELGRTSVTDASIETLIQFKNLRRLHLESTAVTGRTLGKLSALSQLSYLNLSATPVTSDMLAPLKSMPNLRHLYLFETPAEPKSADQGVRSSQ